jgi:hypothetical protein
MKLMTVPDSKSKMVLTSRTGFMAFVHDCDRRAPLAIPVLPLMAL